MSESKETILSHRKKHGEYYSIKMVCPMCDFHTDPLYEVVYPKGTKGLYGFKWRLHSGSDCMNRRDSKANKFFYTDEVKKDYVILSGNLEDVPLDILVGA
jgi:hypothetical protein